MKPIRIAIAALFTLSAPATAQVALDYTEVLVTRFGEVHVAGSDFALTLWRDDAPLDLPEDGRWWIQWSGQGQGFDWVLASHHHGGNACGGASYVLRLAPETTDISPPMDGCNGRFLDIRSGPDWIELDRTDRDITATHVTIRWQGDAFTQTSHFAAPAPPAGAGDDVTRWIGQAPYDIFGDASERARLGTVMQPEEMQTLSTVTLVSSGMARVGDWVIGTGCQPHACGVMMGALGLRISDGAVAAEIRASGAGPVRYGLATDPAFQAAIAEGME